MMQPQMGMTSDASNSMRFPSMSQMGVMAQPNDSHFMYLSDGKLYFP